MVWSSIYNQMWESKLMNYYVLMNDYNSSLMPRYLHAIVDTENQINEKWDYEGSRHDIPYYLLDKECPNTLYLLCNKNIGKLWFNYYQHNMAHILSDRFFDIINEFKLSDHVLKKLIATSIKDGKTINNSLNYLFFTDKELFLNEKYSILEKDKYGNLIPHKLSFHNESLNYDIFSIRTTLLAGFIFISEKVANRLIKENIKRIKLIKLDEVLNHYCVDFKYDIKANVKKGKIKLP
ncbi:hypothetical protein AA106_21020 [Photorhabdus laumondii subsp. laumondii]|uniref:Photorhabdus luminescens subsp. laumondii TTO1 complete genome segment 2/17 n=5 Tax=Photorhabdus TaxID=29487 RepID=Q7N9I7_PHOLL|nr:hypothetical protein A4R40_01690 [Photorhabdus laumondii subsp. laumondii]KTL62250.1 hypothetical protein AA106_21020 [Photorhabdus laumondii subsp. laumondii]RAW62334.1 hypothetical protein CKY15_24405 [Photorhabdus sp. S7-51]RAW64246.1 hypothetical protein CKY14_24290 [Photorhabdus sp. S14-60]CAE12641.1 unnamed protein product [Photorhabdus laumondii subsp. laumondii TTO1]